MKKTLISAILLAGVAAMAAAQGPPPPGPGGPGMAPPPEVTIREVLGLSDPQMEAFHGLLQTRREAVEPLQPQIAEAERAVGEAIHATEPDPTAIGTLTLQLEGLRGLVRAADDAFRDGFLALLNDEQSARLDHIRATEQALHAAQAFHQIGL